MRIRHDRLPAKRTLALALLLLGVGASAVWAKAALIPLPEKVAASDLIATVRIVSTRAKDRREKNRYHNIAEARILRVVKGDPEGDAVEVEFDNGLACPNVLYEKGEECLVFLKREPGGRFSTYNTYYGKFLVDNGSVRGWHARPYKSQTTSLDAVFRQIRTHLAEKSSK